MIIFPHQKSKPSTGVQKFVELFVVVDNTEVRKGHTSSALLQELQSSRKLTFVLFLQYKRHGSETKARILGAINHINKVKLGGGFNHLSI